MKTLQELRDDLKIQRSILRHNKKVADLFKAMIEKGLDKLNCDTIILYVERIAFEPKNNSQLTACRKFIKQFCPKWKDRITSIDNPYEDKCLVRYKFKGSSKWGTPEDIIEIWYQCTTETVPESLTKNDQCGFIDRTPENSLQDKTKVFVCKKEEPKSKQEEDVPF